MHRGKLGQSPALAKRDSGFPQASTYLDFIQSQRGARRARVDKRDLFLTADEKMMRIHDIIWQVADTDVPVLVTGEAGAGKDVVAQAIHQAGSEQGRPVVQVNCASIADSQMETELFGHEAGAFPGAHQQQLGKFEQAGNGTVILDEITEVEPSIQAKILEALQSKQIERVGGTGPVPIQSRIIATTSKDIVGLVSKGEFRQDLYYRLYVIHLEIPPLRDRPKDIPLLANHFLEKFRDQFEKSSITFSEKALEKITRHSWPGNVRELQNIVQRAVILADGDTIQVEDVPIKSKAVDNNEDWISALPIGQSLRTVETQFILQTLKDHQGNRTHAARTLGISLRTLRNKINEFAAEGYEVTAPMNGRAS